MAELTNLHSCRCEDVIIVNNIVDIDNSDICLNTCKVTLCIGDRKQLTMTGSPLNGKHINLAKCTKASISQTAGVIQPCCSTKNH